jgi:hypothetical protein
MKLSPHLDVVFNKNSCFVVDKKRRKMIVVGKQQ